MDEINGGQLISMRKLEANRRNAKRSTGPRTPEGKRRVGRNALKHGILASALLLNDHRSEEAAQFEELLCNLSRDLEPVGELEEMMVEQIAVCRWRLRRALRFENEAIARALSEQRQASLNGPVTPEEVVQLIQEVIKETEENCRKVGNNPGLIQQRDSKFASTAYIQSRLRRLRTDKQLNDLWQSVMRREPEAHEALSKTLATDQASAFPSQDTQISRPQEPARRAYEELALPAEKDLNSIQRYETAVYRQLAFAMNQLERLRRARKGEHVPAPVSVQVSSDE